jgi:hypothetical protein
MKKTAKRQKKTTLKSKLKGKEVSTGPAWKGPEVDGITQSLLSKFLVCRERFRIQVIEGWKPADRFSKGLEYGNMWHICEEHFAAGNDWLQPLTQYCARLCKKYPTDQQEIDKWYNVCKIQFPVYVDFWSKHADVRSRTPLLQEENFKVPYELPSGRVVLLRGKFDSVDLIGKGKSAGIYLQENKSKGDIDEEKMRRQLESGFDLQTMMYLIALENLEAERGTNKIEIVRHPVKGVRYNVVRRPLSGGKGSIRQKQGSKNVPAETASEFYDRLKTDYIEAEPEYFFMRWKVEVSEQDIERFKQQCFNPLLEQLCCWYDVMTLGEVKAEIETINYVGGKNLTHYRMPSGIYNPLTEGRETEYDEYLLTGNTVGLERVKNLFPELESEKQ